MCKRSLLLNYSTPTLRKHDEVWLYNFPRKQQATIRCPHGTSWETYEKILFGSGLIHNATSCSIGTPEVRTLPELHRTSYVHLDTPVWYAPNPMPGLGPENSSRMKEDLPAAIHELDDINAQLSTPLRSLDVDTLLHTRLNALRQGRQTPWYLVGTTISCARVCHGRHEARSALRKCYIRKPLVSYCQLKTQTVLLICLADKVAPLDFANVSSLRATRSQ